MSRLSHRHKTVNKNSTCVSGANHEWKEARIRGDRVRLRCARCGSFTAWVPRNLNEQGRQKFSSIPEQGRQASIDYEQFKVDDLRDIAKRRGLKGYSKMNKSALVAVLAS